MAKNKRRTPKEPPAKAAKWLEEYRQGKHPGLTPTPAHNQSIWDTSYIPERYAPTTPEVISVSEAHLGIVIPSALVDQLFIQNGGYIVSCDEYPFESNSVRWTNATVDGILPVESWERASDDHWFDSCRHIQGLHQLIRIASHSESQLCLDYRKTGQKGLPRVAYIDVCKNPTDVAVFTESVDKFIEALVASRHQNESS